MPEAVEKERQFAQFFKDVKAILRQVDVSNTQQKWAQRDYELDEVYTKAQRVVHERLADNFDTAEAVKVLSELVTTTNSYLQQDKKVIKLPLVR